MANSEQRTANGEQMANDEQMANGERRSPFAVRFRSLPAGSDLVS